MDNEVKVKNTFIKHYKSIITREVIDTQYF